MIVIADTSPISYLVSISEIDILPKLYGRVLVPPSVADELRHPHAPEAVRAWIAAPPAGFEVRAPAWRRMRNCSRPTSKSANATPSYSRRSWEPMN